MESICHWDLEVEVAMCPKHGVVLAECPMTEEPGTVGAAVWAVLREFDGLPPGSQASWRRGIYGR